jgi:hypothetical protein
MRLPSSALLVTLDPGPSTVHATAATNGDPSQSTLPPAIYPQ